MRRKRTTTEKFDVLYEVIEILIILIVSLLAKIFQLKSMFFYPVFLSLLLFTPDFFRRKKQFRQIKIMMEVLNLSIEEMRQLIGVSKYDLAAWEKGKVQLIQRQMYDLEDILKKKYFLQFEKEFNEKDYPKEEEG